MRRTPHVLLSVLLALGPLQAWSQDEAAAPAKEDGAKSTVKAGGDESSEVSTPKRRRRARRSSEEDHEIERASGQKPADDDAPKKEPTRSLDVRDDDDGTAMLSSIMNSKLPPRRYAYIAGAVLVATGFAFAYAAQGQAKRAETITSAAEAQRAIQGAQASATTANILFCIGGASVLYALVLELLPDPVAEKASLTFRF